jgi:hypothetical protein
VAFDSELPGLEAEMRRLAEQKNPPFAFMASEPALAGAYPTILSPYANVTNTLAARAWQGFGNIIGAVASIEIAQATDANDKMGFAECAGYPVELMISENDLFFELDAAPNGGESVYELADPRGNRFRIIRVGGRTVILKPK